MHISKNIYTCDRKGLPIQIIKVVNDLNVKAAEATENSKESCIKLKYKIICIFSGFSNNKM